MMLGWLLLAGEDGGEARRVLDVRVAKDPPVLERESLKVDRATVNGLHHGDLALSARHGGNVALGLLFRELNRNDPIARLWIDLEAPSMGVHGRSGELLFGLVTYLRLAGTELPKNCPASDFMATGTLDREGNVGSVEQVAAKVRAALAASPGKGSCLFYPRANEGQIDDALRIQCRDNGITLCPVNRIDEALDSLGVPLLGSWPRDISPFRSLQAFDTSFSRVFFGRQREVAALTALLDARAASGRPGALIIGASGAGKSSFCLAGVLPALAKAQLGLEYAVWRPRDAVSGRGEEPADAQDVTASIVAQWQVRDENQTGFSLARPTTGVANLGQLPDCLATGDHCRVFVVDQFEELFTLAVTPEARIAFARFLQSLQAHGVWVIGTLRSEFYPQYLELADEDAAPVLTPMFEGDGQYNLPRMSTDSLAQVIMRPAELAGLQFEQRSDGVALSQSLLADAMATEDALPLLGFALQTLYDDAERPDAGEDRDAAYPRTLTFAAYNRLDGLNGAIGVVAAQAYCSVDQEAQAELPALLSAMAVPSLDGSRESARPAPIGQWPVGSAGRRLISELTNIGVLVSEEGATPDAPALVRVAHEALFSHWDVAAKLLSESRQSRLLIQDFRQRASVWDADDRPKESLLSSPRDIANGRDVLLFVPADDGNGPLIAFIENSIARVRRQRQFLYSSVAAAALVLVGLTGWATYAADRANKQTLIARSERSSAIATLAEAAIDRGDAMTGILLARSQLQRGDEANWTSAIQSALLRGMLANREIATLHGGEGEDALASVSFSADGTSILTHQRSGTVKAWPLTGRGAEPTEVAKYSQDDAILQFSDDGRQIFFACCSGNIEIRSLGISAVKRLKIADFYGGGAVKFSPNGRRLVSIYDLADEIQFWSLDGSRSAPIVLPWNDGIVKSLEFSPDSQRLLIASQFGTVRLWSLSGDRPISMVLKESASQVDQASFSPDGQKVLLAMADGTAEVRSLDTRRNRTIVLRGHSGPVVSAAFSADGQRVVTASIDGTARVWSFPGGQPTSIVLSGHQDALTHASFSPDGNRIVTASYDRTARVWTMDGKSIVLAGHLEKVSVGAFSSDGKRVLTISDDRTARAWSLDGMPDPARLTRFLHAQETAVAVSPDGRQTMAGFDDGTAKVWTRLGRTTTSVVLPSMTEGGEPIRSAAFTPDGHHLVTVYDAGTVRVWTLGSGQPSSIALTNHISAGGEVKMNEKGTRIAVVESGGFRVRLWTWRDRQYTSTVLVEGSDYIGNVAVSDDGQSIAAATRNQISVWSLQGSRSAPQTFKRLDGRTLTELKFSPGGDHLIAIVDDGDARLWTLGKSNSAAVRFSEEGVPIMGAALSLDGRSLVTFGGDYTARVWKLDNVWRPAGVLYGHTKHIADAQFDPDSSRILTKDVDGTTRLWITGGARPGSILFPFTGDEIKGATFSADGRYLVTVSREGVVRRHYVPIGKELLAWSSLSITRCLTYGQSIAIGLRPPPRRHGMSIVGLDCGAF